MTMPFARLELLARFSVRTLHPPGRATLARERSNV